MDAEGEELERNSFWVRSEEEDVALATDKTTYAVGEPIEVTWDDGPANRWDWIGVYEADAANPAKDDYLLWGYTGGHEAGALPPTVFGAMTMGPDSQGKPWPLPPGDYRIHYLLADQYDSAGYVEVTVERAPRIDAPHRDVSPGAEGSGSPRLLAWPTSSWASWRSSPGSPCSPRGSSCCDS